MGQQNQWCQFPNSACSILSIGLSCLVFEICPQHAQQKDNGPTSATIAYLALKPGPTVK